MIPLFSGMIPSEYKSTITANPNKINEFIKHIINAQNAGSDYYHDNFRTICDNWIK